MQVHCLFAFCNTIQARYTCPRDSFPCTLIAFTFGGRGAMVHGGERASFGPASVLVRQANEVYWVEQVSLGQHLCLGVRGCHAERIATGSFPQTQQQRALAADLHALVTSGGDHAQMRIELLAGLAALSMFEQHPADEPRGVAQRARAILEAEFREQLVIGAVARRLHVSAAHLREQFHSTYGEPPIAYLLTRRLVRAKELLQDGRIPIGQVAELCGFRDPFYFSRQFRLRTGRTPSDWRARGSQAGFRLA